MRIKEAMKEIHELAIKKGWWEKERSVPELLCLVHSEVSEALEAYREGKRLNFAEELADVIIRVFDMAYAFEIDLEEAIQKKHEYNKSRPYRHGNKLC